MKGRLKPLIDLLRRQASDEEHALTCTTCAARAVTRPSPSTDP